jgi:uncharacterized phage protein (TIGR01671 family)
MREIKFRVWDKGLKKMFNWPIDIGYWLPDDGKSVLSGWILMQFTGLKDKNGKEIYEGDICHAYKANSYLKGNYEVVWDTKRGRWAYKGNTYQVGSSGNLDCEVIGNVFQNNDLL